MTPLRTHCLKQSYVHNDSRHFCHRDTAKLVTPHLYLFSISLCSQGRSLRVKWQSSNDFCVTNSSRLQQYGSVQHLHALPAFFFKLEMPEMHWMIALELCARHIYVIKPHQRGRANYFCKQCTCGLLKVSSTLFTSGTQKNAAVISEILCHQLHWKECILWASLSNNDSALLNDW